MGLRNLRTKAPPDAGIDVDMLTLLIVICTEHGRGSCGTLRKIVGRSQWINSVDVTRLPGVAVGERTCCWDRRMA